METTPAQFGERRFACQSSLRCYQRPSPAAQHFASPCSAPNGSQAARRAVTHRPECARADGCGLLNCCSAPLFSRCLQLYSAALSMTRLVETAACSHTLPSLSHRVTSTTKVTRPRASYTSANGRSDNLGSIYTLQSAHSGVRVASKSFAARAAISLGLARSPVSMRCRFLCGGGSERAGGCRASLIFSLRSLSDSRCWRDNRLASRSSSAVGSSSHSSRRCAATSLFSCCFRPCLLLVTACSRAMLAPFCAASLSGARALLAFTRSSRFVLVACALLCCVGSAFVLLG